MPPSLLTLHERIEMYRWMRLTRAFDDRMVAMWKQGRGVGGTFIERGHEAISVGAAMALAPDDVVAPMHRDLGCYLVRGMTPERIFRNLLGRAGGVTEGRDANLHGLGDLRLGLIGFVSHLPMSMPVALGAAMAFRYRSEERAALTFTGDGASSTGAWHETLNMAGVYRAPLVVVVENNQYAYSTPLRQQTAVTDVAQRAAGYGMPGVVIDGNDVELVHSVVDEALTRARSGGGPSLIEAKTMRMLGHAVHDGAEYVPAGLLAQWEARDPLARYEASLLALGVEASELRAIDETAAAQIDHAVAEAEAAPWPDPSTVAEGVFAP
jgi:pyruvate dehydrogenase E1 component alpha subunit